ncbi:DUF3667 domain-containing protein [Aliidiomarina sanyensis]|uniref:DUF3667 domain-containing protein n=1 Tax=Aliidiomarina sanyensis TaxID=1249555 RepID=A0A432WMX7_9GAMM|nr:hypothetical protein CWE11_03805 [Aliidiomarina sanyensis]
MALITPTTPDDPARSEPQSESVDEVSPKTSCCANCHTPLLGAFCHVCGQEDKNYIRNVFRLITELFGEMGNWDGRLWRTLIPLMVRPAFLSNQYVAGKRAPYVPPLRLYIFVSLIAFIVFSNLGSGLQFLGTNDPAVQQIFEEQWDDSLPRYSSGTGEIQIGFLDEAQNAEINAKLQFLQQHPKIFIERFFSLAPQFMLVMLPIFALLLKGLYILSGRYYVEHMVLALHTHGFILLSLLFILAINQILTWSIPQLFIWPLEWLVIVAWWWIPIMLLLTQKRFYRQSWGLTLFKFFLTSFIYSVVLACMLFVTIILSVLGT